jgi:AAA+ superfamily predicted ATPase
MEQLLRSISPSYFIEVTKHVFPNYCYVSDEVQITIRVYVEQPGRVLIEDTIPSSAEIRQPPQSSSKENVEYRIVSEKIIIWLKNEKLDLNTITYSLAFRRRFDGNLEPAIVRIGGLTRYSNTPRLRVVDSPARQLAPVEYTSKRIQLSSSVESARTMFQPDHELPELRQVVGHEKAIEEIRKYFIDPLIKSDSDPSNIVIEGPSGCGKSMLARASLKEIQKCWEHAGNMYFKIVSGSDLADPEAVRMLFDNAERSKPSIIIIENIELLTGYSADQSMAVLLSRIHEATFHNKGIYVIVTTSSPRCLPAEFWNSGSFKRVRLKKPSEKEIQELLERTIGSSFGYPLPELSKKLYSHGFSHRDVISIARDILREKITRKSLDRDDIERIVQRKVSEVRGPYEVSLESKRIPPLDVFVYPEHVMKKLMLVKDRIENPEKYIRMGLNPGQAIIIKGPHGTGKSTLPLSIAKACEARVFQIDSRVIRGIVGETEHEIRNIFDSALSSLPAIILIDEVHQLIPVSQRTEEFTFRVFHTLSTEIENSLQERVAIIATSSASEEISISYFTRLFEVIELPLPSSPEERLQILVRNAKAFGFKVEGLEKYAADNYTNGWSGKKLLAMLTHASSYAIRDGKHMIDEACLDEAYLYLTEVGRSV